MKKTRLYFTEKYLQNRPAFFALIRPIEAYLMYSNRKKLKGRILDFGCGDGFFANLVFNKKFVDVGLDVETSIMNEAVDKIVYKNITTYDGSIIPYKDDYFGSAFSNSVLEHVPDLSGNLKEISRVIKPGGYFMTTVMTKRWDEYLLGNLFGKSYGEWFKKKQDHKNLLSAEEWEKRFEKAGFMVEEKVGYLDKRRSNWLEYWHYLSAPSLVSRLFFGRWVVWNDWYLFLNLHLIFERMNKQSFTDENKASSVFYILKKRNV